MAQDSRVSINPLGAQSLSRGGGRGMMGGQAISDFANSMGSSYQKMLADMVKLSQKQAETNEAAQVAQQEGLRDIINSMTRKAEQERSIEASTEAREHSATLNRETSLFEADEAREAAKRLAYDTQQIHQQELAYVAKVKEYKTQVTKYRTMLAMERTRIDSLSHLPFSKISALKLTLGVSSGKPKVIRGYAVINRLNLLLRHAETFEGPFMEDPPFLRTMQRDLQTTIGKIIQGMDFEDMESFKHEPFMLPVPKVKGAKGEPDLLEDFRDFRHHQLAGGYAPTGVLDFKDGDPRWSFINPHDMGTLLHGAVGRAFSNQIKTLAGRDHEINKRSETLLESFKAHTKYSEHYDGSVTLYESLSRGAFEQGLLNFAMSLDSQAILLGGEGVRRDMHGRIQQVPATGGDMSSWENPAKSLQKFIMIELLGSEDAFDYMDKMGVPGNGIDLTSPMQGFAAMNYTAALDVFGDRILGMAEGTASYGLKEVTKALSRHPQLVKRLMQSFPDVARGGYFSKGHLVTDPESEGGSFLASTVLGLLERAKATTIQMSAVITNSTAWRNVEEAGGVLTRGMDANAVRAVTRQDLFDTLINEHLADGQPMKPPEYTSEVAVLTDNLEAMNALMEERGPGLGTGEFIERFMSADLPDPTGIMSEVDEWLNDSTLGPLKELHNAREDDRINQSKIHQASYNKKFAPTQGPETGPPGTPGPPPGQAPGPGPEMGPTGPAPPPQPAPQDIPVNPQGPAHLQGP